MKIAIAGITGFVGSNLKTFFAKKGIEVKPITRFEFEYSYHDLGYYLSDCDVLINLVGAPVIKRWTLKHKMEIFRSRVDTTKKLVETLSRMTKKPALFVNSSAIGIYDYENENDEYTSNFGSNFLSDVVVKWEEEALKAQDIGLRTAILRFGVVLGNNGGAFPLMSRPFKYGVGGKLGSGRQVMSFIHIKDLIDAIQFIIDNEALSGVFNLVAPEYCTNAEFTKVLSDKIKKPAFFKVPAFIIRLFFGKASEVVVGGEKVRPKRLIESGFTFKYPNISAALTELLDL